MSARDTSSRSRPTVHELVITDIDRCLGGPAARAAARTLVADRKPRRIRDTRELPGLLADVLVSATQASRETDAAGDEQGAAMWLEVRQCALTALLALLGDAPRDRGGPA